ncbi:glycine oxidase ThiO [Halopseudomonas nanhaiensis]|uniref:glycine oxidase ThiO n=1 Tax=Halopseudomonas nanhaiensis TaxID=2830842 RepID=UPI001CC12AAA|nr:glycine oxidase ThiO [Halopseudomonas nanhaiensis]UAW99074.1 glycine oxidase ThiO [Halopseudomonas nanhaiensis]
MQDVIIVGGGIMGCLTALNLLEAGARVTLLERQRAGREASWAGGGIVSPLYPWRYGDAVQALAVWSQGFYPRLAAQLAQRTGIDPQVSSCGLMWLDHAEQGQALSWARSQGQPLRRVDSDFIYRQVPNLAPGFTSALWQADLANVRNPRLMSALLAWLAGHRHFTLLEQSPATELVVREGRVEGVRTSAGVVKAGAVVLAAGAWSGDWLAPLGVSLPVQPVKGQMQLYRCAPGWLPSMVLFEGRYAIPRQDGHVLIGSTLEHSGFDASTTAEGFASLRQSALRLLPALAELQPVGQWAGLRPGSPDGIPFIGQVPGVSGLWLNAGHYRNGLVLAPASCRLAADLILGRAPEIDPSPYAPAERLAPR